jgi:hypothetical protein
MIVGFRNDSMAICELMNWMGIEGRRLIGRGECVGGEAI